MTRIDRYLLLLYLRVFAICFITLAGLLIVAQVFTNLDEFIQFGKARGSFFRALVEYYSPVMLAIFDRTCGLLALLSTMFVIAWLYRNNEMTALLAAGISKARIIRPIMVMSIIAIVAAACSRELFIPTWASSLSKSPQDLQGGERMQSMRPTVDADMELLIAGRNLETNSRSIVNPVFKFNGPVSDVVDQIHGARAVFLEADGEHPQGFLVEGLTAKSMLQGKSSIRADGELRLMLPADTPWLAADACFIPSHIEYDMLLGGASKQFASTADLIWKLNHQPDYYGADLKFLVHSRFLQPFLDLTQLMLGLPLILTTRNRNVVGLVVVCLGTFGLFYAVSAGFGSLASRGTLVTPAVAAWAPLIAFGPLAYARARAALME